MPWVYLDDHFPEHPKTTAAGGDAAWLFVCALAYCNRRLTHGRVPKSFIPQLSDRKQAGKLAERLVQVGYIDDDYDRQLEGLWRDWAQLDLEARETETGKRVRDPGSWLETARNRRRKAHADHARALWAAEPDLGVDDVIRRLEKPRLSVVQDGHQRHRTDWGSTGDEVWETLPDGTVRRRGETA
jgi:hypothetical protein